MKSDPDTAFQIYWTAANRAIAHLDEISSSYQDSDRLKEEITKMKASAQNVWIAWRMAMNAREETIAKIMEGD